MSKPTDFHIMSGELVKYNGRDAEVVIPYGVTKIGDRAFRHRRGVRSVTVPPGLWCIGDFAFSGCSSLTEIRLQDGLKSIGEYAFLNCTSLSRIVLPASVKTLSEGVFRGCTSITEVVVPDGVTSIEDEAFCDCSGVRKLYIPESVEHISSSAFMGCGNIKSITVSEKNPAYYSKNGCLIEKATGTLLRGCNDSVIPAGVRSIAEWAFSNCREKRSIVVPEGVGEIGRGAFWACLSLKEVSIAAGVKEIGPDAFYFCRELRRIDVPEGVVTIGDRAFSDCSSAVEITVPESTVSIGSSAFEGCSSLKTLTIPNSAVKMGESLFRGISPIIVTDAQLTASALKKSRVREIRTNDIYKVPTGYRLAAIKGLFSEEEIDPCSARVENHMKYLKDNAAKIIREAFGNVKILIFMCENMLIPAKHLGAYMEEAEKTGDTELLAMFLDYANKLGDAVNRAEEKKEADSERFMDEWFKRNSERDENSGISGLCFVVSGRKRRPYSHAEFTEYLEECGATLGTSVSKKTDYFVFDEEEPLTKNALRARELDIPLLTREEFDLMICAKYRDEKYVEVPRWVKRILPKAFFECGKLESVTIPEGVKSIGSSAFEHCRELTGIALPDSMEFIGDWAFAFCSKFNWIRIPAGMKKISHFAFFFCRSLTVYGPAGSFAEQFAKENNWRFIAE